MKKKKGIFSPVPLAMILLLASFNSCNFAQSVNKDLVSGLVTRGNGLSCENVYLSINGEKTKQNEFIYGATFHVNFDGMGGLTRIDENTFPGMELVVTNERGDTVMSHGDLYEAYEKGISFTPLQLNSELTVADPIHSGESYTLFINIWDKEGNGTFRATLDFTVVPNKEIQITSNQLTYKEIYLFSQKKGATITDNEVGFGETVYLLFEGLDGFKVESGNVSAGLSLSIRDADGELILEEKDLMGDAAMNYDEIHTQLAPNFVLSGNEISNPVSCEITIWDKKSNASINAVTRLRVN